MSMQSKRAASFANNTGAVLSPGELCHGISDSEKEYATAWEYARQLIRNCKKSARLFHRLRKANRRRNRYKLSFNLLPTAFFKNRHALTFLISPCWPKKPFAELSRKEKQQAFPDAPIFQEPLKVPRIGAFMLPAENITPNGTWSPRWSSKVLDAMFQNNRIPFRTKSRLLLIDTSYDQSRIEDALLHLLRKETQNHRTKGRNKYEAALKELALLRAEEAGWLPEQFDELWRTVGIAHPLSNNTPHKTACGVAFEARRKRIKCARQRLISAFRWAHVKG